MKFRTLLLLVLTSQVALLCTAIAFSQANSSHDGPSKDIRLLTLQVKSDKSSYLPGELITLDFRMSNDSKEAVMLPKSVDVWSGHLQVFISDETNDYKMYKGPRWGLADVIGGSAGKLAPGDSFKTPATVLHNYRLETSHLNDNSAAQISKGLIRTEYVLPEPGLYFIKAVLTDDALENKIESEPVRVVIEEPQGVDLEVWNKIKDDGSYARFIQTGGLVEAPNGQKTKRVVATLEEIENSQPNSRYLGQIRVALAKRRATLKKNK
jgi:hypothetical protein